MKLSFIHQVVIVGSWNNVLVHDAEVESGLSYRLIELMKETMINIYDEEVSKLEISKSSSILFDLSEIEENIEVELTDENLGRYFRDLTEDEKRPILMDKKDILVAFGSCGQILLGVF